MDFVAYIAAWAIIVLLLADRRRYLARVESKSRCNPRHAREGAEAMKEADIDDALKRLRKPVYDGGGEELDMDDAIGAIVHLRAELARVEAERDEARRLLMREEEAHETTLAQRDAAEQFANDVYQIVVGEPAQWSNLFGLNDARDDIEEAFDAALSRAESARREAFEEVEAFCSARDRGTPDAGSNAMRFIASHFGTMARALLDAPADGKREVE